MMGVHEHRVEKPLYLSLSISESSENNLNVLLTGVFEIPSVF